MDEEKPKETPDPFSYENLNRALIREKNITVESARYNAFTGDGRFVGEKGFIYISRHKKLGHVSEENKKLAQMGLKFHISLPEKNRNSFKIAHENVRMSEDPSNGSQRGKDITIYFKHNADQSFEFWQTVMQEITDALVKANISPGYRPPREGKRGDKPFPGSEYISYRYEKADFPEESEDPVQKLSVDNPRQLPPMPWDSHQNHITLLTEIVSDEKFWIEQSRFSANVPAGVAEIKKILEQKNVSDSVKWSQIQAVAKNHVNKTGLDWMLQRPVTEALYQAILNNRPKNFMKQYRVELNISPQRKFN